MWAFNRLQAERAAPVRIHTRDVASGIASGNLADREEKAAAQPFGGAASSFARLRRRRAASACFLRRFTLGFM